MTVYSPYQDAYSLLWYVDVMTPNGLVKQNITNPLYYFQMMSVNPPVGANFSEEIVEDFEDMCADAEAGEMDFFDDPALEPYATLNLPTGNPPATMFFDSLASYTTKPVELPAVFMSINAESTALSSSSLIPLTTPFVSVKSLNSSQTNEETNMNRSYVPKKDGLEKKVTFDSIEIDETEYFSPIKTSVQPSPGPSHQLPLNTSGLASTSGQTTYSDGAYDYDEFDEDDYGDYDDMDDYDDYDDYDEDEEYDDYDDYDEPSHTKQDLAIIPGECKKYVPIVNTTAKPLPCLDKILNNCVKKDPTKF